MQLRFWSTTAAPRVADHSLPATRCRSSLSPDRLLYKRASAGSPCYRVFRRGQSWPRSRTPPPRSPPRPVSGHGCPVKFRWTRRTALIPLGIGRWGTIRTRAGDNAMRHQNSVFHGVLQGVPWDVFDQLVEAHGADWRVRQLTTRSQFVALLYGQLEGASSLREIEAGLESHQSRLYHLGVSAPRRSTLADANTSRPCAVFSELFAVMAERAHRPLRRGLAETTYLIDATGLRLDGRSLDWARFSAKVCGVKLPRRLRCRCRPADLCRDHPGAHQRHYPSPGHADRAGCHLCL